jgi:hypothetical protein
MMAQTQRVTLGLTTGASPRAWTPWCPQQACVTRRSQHHSTRVTSWMSAPEAASGQESQTAAPAARHHPLPRRACVTGGSGCTCPGATQSPRTAHQLACSAARAAETVGKAGPCLERQQPREQKPASLDTIQCTHTRSIHTVGCEAKVIQRRVPKAPYARCVPIQAVCGNNKCKVMCHDTPSESHR